MNVPKKNWLEWTVFGLSLVVVLGALGALAYGAATSGDSAPQIVLELGPPERQPAGFAVPVTLRNEGDITAEGVEVEVTLERDGQDVEQGGFTVAFVPRDSSAEGWVMFREDPSTGQLRATVLGFEAP
ncbi:MAG: hypothetical protein H7Y32_15745 [Chloroflexales bacterium]|nr:hypothetical protein [Chloroflexales bacterium]